MAARRKAIAKGKDTRTKTKASAAALEVKIVVDTSSETPTYYVNHAEVSHTQHDFTMAVLQLPSKLSPVARQIGLETGEVHLNTILQLTFPPTLLPGLVKALNVQRKKYEDKFDKIREIEVEDTK